MFYKHLLISNIYSLLRLAAVGYDYNARVYAVGNKYGRIH